MSGIAGIFLRDGRTVETEGLRRVTRSIAHRGPDAAGLWQRGSIGLVHVMLRTTPESLGEEQPLAPDGGGLVVTADARIDNRDELQSALGTEAGSLREAGDAELILRAYERWGERCVERLLGDFAFAVWDGRTRTLFCARDHFGVKQLYYFCSGGQFVFASEIKGVLNFKDVPRRVNEERIADYLIANFEDQSATLYEGVLRLPPGHAISVDASRVRMRRYWALEPAREVRFKDNGQYAEAFREVFTEAVRCRLRSAGPAGATLSGGLDSSSITCVARDLLAGVGGGLRTFSAIYDEVPECDERKYINSVLSRGGVQPFYAHPERFSPLSDCEGLSSEEDEPLWNPQTAIHWAVYSEAREQKVCVLLDGVGGDFVVSHGLTYLTELARTGRWLRFAAEAEWLARRYKARRGRIFWRRAVQPLAPDWARKARRALRPGGREGQSAIAHVRPEFAKRLRLGERAAMLDAARRTSERSSRGEHFRQLSSGLSSFSLGLLDRTAPRFQIEGRYPFLDRRLMEFCLGLPADQKLRRGWTRYIVRAALENVLPEQIRCRVGKANHSPNFNRGLSSQDRPELDDLILSTSGPIGQFVEMSVIRQTYRRYLSTLNNDDGMTVWGVAMLARWLNRESVCGSVSPEGDVPLAA